MTVSNFNIQKHKWLYEIDVEVKEPEIRWSDNKPATTITIKPNKKQERALIKGVRLTDKYVRKMKKLGFVGDCDIKSITAVDEYTLARKKIEEEKENGTV